MVESTSIWLVCNEASGSNDEAALESLLSAARRASLSICGTSRFPAEPIPGPDELDEAGCRVLAVFAGDGTVSAAVTGLYGWDGAVLVLPGGTMNFLSRKLHGDAQPADILERFARGAAHAVRPAVIRSSLGDALTEVIVGPGAEWNEVREAIRDADIVEAVQAAATAIGDSTDGPRVHCRDCDTGRDAGYPVITIAPGDEGLSANGYYAETLGDFARQGFAIFRHDFRNGPHEALGVRNSWRIGCDGGEALRLLIDGDPQAGGDEEEFRLARCEVDLLKTADDA